MCNSPKASTKSGTVREGLKITKVYRMFLDSPEKQAKVEKGNVVYLLRKIFSSLMYGVDAAKLKILLEVNWLGSYLL